jgi:hypothetical protein
MPCGVKVIYYYAKCMLSVYFMRQNFGPSGTHPWLALARAEGSACGEVDRVLVSLHSGDALTTFGGGLRFAGS